METLEIPVVEDLDERPSWSDAPPVKFEEQEMDLAAFHLWRQASCWNESAEEDAG